MLDKFLWSFCMIAFNCFIHSIKEYSVSSVDHETYTQLKMSLTRDAIFSKSKSRVSNICLLVSPSKHL